MEKAVSLHNPRRSFVGAGEAYRSRCIGACLRPANKIGSAGRPISVYPTAKYRCSTGYSTTAAGKFSPPFDSSYQFIPAGQKFLAILRCAGIMGPVVY